MIIELIYINLYITCSWLGSLFDEVWLLSKSINVNVVIIEIDIIILLLIFLSNFYLFSIEALWSLFLLFTSLFNRLFLFTNFLHVTRALWTLWTLLFLLKQAKIFQRFLLFILIVFLFLYLFLLLGELHKFLYLLHLSANCLDVDEVQQFQPSFLKKFL